MRWNEMNKNMHEVFFKYEICSGRKRKHKSLATFKHIDCNNSKDRNQADKVYLPNYWISDKKYFWLWFITFLNMNRLSWLLERALKSLKSN